MSGSKVGSEVMLVKHNEAEIPPENDEIQEKDVDPANDEKIEDASSSVLVVDKAIDNEALSDAIGNIAPRRSALPPAEMFEIRNSPPLPAVGNKKLKKLMERNKGYAFGYDNCKM